MHSPEEMSQICDLFTNLWLVFIPKHKGLVVGFNITKIFVLLQFDPYEGFEKEQGGICLSKSHLYSFKHYNWKNFLSIQL